MTTALPPHNGAGAIDVFGLMGLGRLDLPTGEQIAEIRADAERERVEDAYWRDKEAAHQLDETA